MSKKVEGGAMRFRTLCLIGLGILWVVVAFAPAVAMAESDQDSLWVVIDNYSTAELNKKLSLTLSWSTSVKPYNARRRRYGGWEKYDKQDELTYRVTIATDSAFTAVVKTQDVKAREITLQELEFGTRYWAKVEPINVPNPYKAEPGEGKIYQESASAGAGGGKGNVFTSFWKFSKSGGILMPFIYALAIFGLLVVVPVTWWQLRLTNIFPPNKPDLIYGVLPIDRIGKSDYLTDKGNVYIREVAKYWTKAMEAQSMKPSLWPSEEDYIKASMQEQEEMKKKLWLKVGLPNIEKAIDICKNGVPGIKLKKKPLEYPFPRVLLSALENHRSNRNAWWASQEMDRAVANTAQKEIDALSGWTVNALWALGSVEPMLGLFGTVIGIRLSFMKIEEAISQNPNAQMNVIVPKLAGGIQIALITTITGLAIGVPFTLWHYYYRSKLDWVYGKWEEIIIDILNRA